MVDLMVYLITHMILDLMVTLMVDFDGGFNGALGGELYGGLDGRIDGVPKRQKSPNRQAEHKLNEGPSRDDCYQISKKSVQTCRKFNVSKKSLRNMLINKWINN